MQSEFDEKSPILDIIFLSYRESNCDRNWEALKARFPRAKRVHGIKGIREAHQEAARLSETDFFFIVDGDNVIRESFEFKVDFELNEDSLYVYRCHNPVNDLIYGFGAVKIYNKELLKKQHSEKYVDLATKMTPKYVIIHEVASETHFFVTPEEAWRGAFRECSKLASGLIDRQVDKETQYRLRKWCEFANPVENSEFILEGAKQGRKFGSQMKDEMFRINDFDWLREKFGNVEQ